MAADEHAQLDHEYHYISPKSDFVVRVIEHEVKDGPSTDGSGRMVCHKSALTHMPQPVSLTIQYNRLSNGFRRKCTNSKSSNLP
jgi:hypothetical protein